VAIAVALTLGACFFLWESEIKSHANINTIAQAKTPWLEYLVVGQELPIPA